MTSSRTWLFIASAAIAIVVIAIVVLVMSDGGFGLVTGEHDAASYLAIFALIAGDAVVPILPGESVLNAAAVLAANGEKELWLVVLMGCLGAIVGDNALYWIARLGGERFEKQFERAKANPRVDQALGILGRRGPLLIVFGRYVPGVRFVVNATMGVTAMPYSSFLLWSSVGGALWGTYTALLAYAVGTAIEDFPLASILISGAVTTFMIAVIFSLESRRSSREPSAASDGSPPA